MKILWISPTPSHPQDAGNRAHIHALAQRVLAARHDVTFVLYGQEKTTPESQEAMKQFWPRFVFVPHRMTGRKKSKGTLWGIDDWYPPDLDAAVRFLSTQEEFDAVICEYVFFSKALTVFGKNTLKILDGHDRMGGRADLLRAQGIEPDFFYTTEAEEKIALDRADLVLAIQPEEKVYYETLTVRSVIELGHPVTEKFVELATPRQPLRVGYLASGNSLNRKGIALFMEALENRPALAAQIELVLAGNICDAIDYPAATLLGFVEREEDFFNEVDLFVNPMQGGTGLKIKTLSALQHGVPIVSTDSGSVGLAPILDMHRCANMGELLDAIQTVVNDPARHLPALRQAGVDMLTAYAQRQDRQMQDLLRALETNSVKHISRRRVLVVTDIAFWERRVGSHTRILSLVQALEKQCTVDVFYFGSLLNEHKLAIRAAGVTARIHSYKDWEAKAVKQAFNSLVSVESLKPWRHESWGRSLQLFVASQARYDVAVFEYIQLAYLKDAFLYPLLSVLDMHDFMALREWRFASQGMRHHIRIQIQIYEELEVLQRFSALMAIQQEEAESLRSYLRDRVVLLCPHGVESLPAGALPRRAGRAGKRVRVGFIGGNSAANAFALNWFLKQVWPVLRHLPVELHVFGDVCKQVQTDADAQVVLHGVVDQLEQLYGDCDIMINPIVHGGGLKIKSVEALAHGKPLVSTPEGATGIADPQASGVLVARSRIEFTEAVMRLARDGALRQKMGQDALAAARAQFNPDLCFEPLLELVNSV